MLGRILLALIFIISIGWIGFVGFDILNVKSNFSPETLFSVNDGKVLVVNRSNEVDFMQITDFSDSPIATMFQELATENCTAFISQKQAHLLLNNTSNWNESSIISLFSDAYNVSFSGSNFTAGEYEGRYFKSSLYLFQGEISKNQKEALIFNYDQKASASIIEINEASKVASVEDIYFLPSGKVNYIMRDEAILQGKKVKDEVLFGGILTSKFATYHFHERDYYSTKDSTFSKSPMFQWTLNGFVVLDYKGQKVIVSDYIDGQDPILILNDLHQTQDKSVFKDRLLVDFPSKGASYHIKYLEDLVVISESETTCDQVIADFKLGNTIALNKFVHNQVFGNLPKLVSERFISNDVSYSKTVYQGRILQTRFGAGEKEVIIEKQETISMNCEFDIVNFVVSSGVGNVVVQGKENELACFEDGKLTWSKKFEQKIIGEIEVIDLYSNGELFTLVNTSSKIHLINSKGKYSSGFPVELEEEATNQVKFYRWKGKSYLLIALANKEIIHLDGEGRELTIFNSKELVSEQIDVWASQNKLFAGFSNTSFFEMFNLEKSISHRSFSLPIKTLTTKIPNELRQYGIENNSLIKLDQKGSKSKYSSFDNSQLLKIVNDNKNPILLLKSSNEIHLLNSEGIPFGLIKLAFNEVDDIDLITMNSEKTIIGVVDGLENNVYLYHANGELLIKKSLEGQRKVQLENSAGSIQVTTIVDQFIIQYFN
ncbi:MAG TPA: hypothetical protein EYG86_06420 [Crocinitomicaceae bacterium]|nr:hypothetical protein [Crocinitomicaceae bacterium]